MWTYNAKMLRVIDGDTIEADIDLGFDMHYIAKVRLAGINAPEMKTPQGAPAKARLTEMLTDYPNLIITTKLNKEFEKYGRVLGEITTNGWNVNQQMITEGFAIPMKG
jgi:micrococcal nuclease